MNFNDSAAIFGPMPDLLMHIAARVPKGLSKEAALASWLFDHLYGENPAQGPFDRSTFGFVNRCGFLSVLLRPKAPAPLSPEDAGLALTSRFSNGNCILRSSWNEAGTVLAFNGASDPLSAPGHLHRDLGSFILVHEKERLLADPGHSCYRNLIHDVECSTKAHNCCSFKVHGSGELLEQRGCAQRKIGSDGKLLDLVKRPGEHLLCASIDDVSVAASELADAYGKPLVSYKRFCILAGEHAVFVVDSIESSEPVAANWNWLLNNRDGQLDFKLVHPDRLVARRGNAGMKLFHIGDASLSGPIYGYIHDAYHPLPNQLGEGKPGSGLHFAWSGKESMRQMAGHAIVADSYGLSAGWHMRAKSPSQFALEAPGGSCFWELSMDYEAMTLREAVSGRSYSIAKGQNGNWSLSR